MALTVADCLKLPSLYGSEVLAGQAGLSGTVEYITVLEANKVSDIANEFLRKNELTISSLIAVKDNVDEQCALIRHLHAHGEVGLILFHANIFMSHLDQRFLETADELDFPIIRTPDDRLELKYSDVIYEVMEAILQDNLRQSYFVTNMLERISGLQNGAHDIDTVLSLLATELKCPLMLTDRMFRPIAYGAGTGSHYFDPEEIAAAFKSADPVFISAATFLKLPAGDKTLTVYCHPIHVEQHIRLNLITIDPAAGILPSLLEQAAEVIRLFMGIWHYDYDKDTEKYLIKAILEGDILAKNRLAKELHIDVGAICNLWVLLDRLPIHVNEAEAVHTRELAVAKLFLQEHGQLILAGMFQERVTAFLNLPSGEKQLEDLPQMFMDTLGETAANTILVVCNNIENPNAIKSAYQLMEKTLNAAKLVYPHKKIFNQQDLAFVERCQNVIVSGEDSLRSYAKILDPLRRIDEEGDDLLTLLMTMMLDTQMNTAETATLLFLHRNTIYYRLRHIKQVLGYDPFVMPAMNNIYTALAIERLLKTN